MSWCLIVHAPCLSVLFRVPLFQFCKYSSSFSCSCIVESHFGPSMCAVSRWGRGNSGIVKQRYLGDTFFPGFASESLCYHVSDCCSVVSARILFIFWRMLRIVMFSLLLCSAVGAEGAFGACRCRGATCRFSMVFARNLSAITFRTVARWFRLVRSPSFGGCTLS